MLYDTYLPGTGTTYYILRVKIWQFQMVFSLQRIPIIRGPTSSVKAPRNCLEAVDNNLQPTSTYCIGPTYCQKPKGLEDQAICWLHFSTAQLIPEILDLCCVWCYCYTQSIIYFLNTGRVCLKGVGGQYGHWTVLTFIKLVCIIVTTFAASKESTF